MKYYIADLHNYDPNIMMYEHRKFTDLEHMRTVMVRNIRERVGKEDKLFIAGDIGNPEILGDIAAGLDVTVVAGNHDDVDELRRMYPNIEVSRYPIVDGYTIISHKPMGVMPKELPYLNIHGHIHSYMYGTSGTWADGRRHFCVSVEQTNYFPVSELEIIEALKYRQCMERPISAMHRMKKA